VFTEGAQASAVLTLAVTPSEMPIHCVGVLAPSDVFITDYF
jgi:hypothetical protein